MQRRLSKHFFLRPTLEVARDLIGMRLSTDIAGKRTSGMIVEVEAYHGEIDEASHAYGGPSSRNKVMFEEGGHCYVYFIYGMHYCVNVVTEQKDIGAGVLIRAIEPLDGIEIMKRRRGFNGGKIFNLTNGPSKLCQALSIDKKILGHHYLSSANIRIDSFRKFPAVDIASDRRIGISKAIHLKWRFLLKDNPWISRKAGI